MVYTSQDDFVKFATTQRTSRLTDDELGEVLDGAVLERVNEEVVSELHAYLRGVAAELPLLEPIDPLVTLTVNEMMLARLYQRRNPSEYVPGNAYYEMYQNALKRLVRIQRGEVRLMMTGQTESVELRGVSVYAPPQRFKDGFNE